MNEKMAFVQSAASLPFCTKVSTGRIEHVTPEEATEVVSGLSGGDTKVSCQMMITLMHEVLGLPESDSIRAVGFIPSTNGFITGDDVCGACSAGDLGDSLRHAVSKMAHRKTQELGATVSGEGEPLSRDFFVNRMVWRVNRDDSFTTLPTTLVYLIVFMLLVIFHLQIFKRQQVQTGMEEYLGQFGKSLSGPFIGEHVSDVNSFWTWLSTSGVDAAYGRFDNSRPGALPILHLGARNVLIGDVRLRQETADGESYVWLLHQQKAIDHLASNPNDYKSAATDALYHLDQIRWMGANTSLQLWLEFSTYVEEAGLFTINVIDVNFRHPGQAIPQIKSLGVLAQPYTSWAEYIVDGIYLLIVCNMFFHEAKDVFHSARLGFGEFVDYWSVWNVVDWLSIVMGFGASIVWITCCRVTGDAFFQQLVNRDSHLVTSNVMQLSESELETVWDELNNIKGWFIVLHIVIAVNTASIVARLFKGFQANPKLKVVMDTLNLAAPDMIHFMIVFLTLFLSFAVIAHVLFGGDLPVFYTTAMSLNTVFFVLMGEFSWFSELSMVESVFLPSGCPVIFVKIWFYTYMFFVLLVLLNMLLAIILDRYNEVMEKQRGGREDMTIWTQAYRFINRKRAAWGYVPESSIRRQLENDYKPAHPAPQVTVDSLLEAFPSMKGEQANKLIKWLDDEKAKQVQSKQPFEGLVRAQRAERMVHAICENVHTLQTDAHISIQRLNGVEARLRNAGLINWEPPAPPMTPNCMSDSSPGGISASRPTSPTNFGDVGISSEGGAKYGNVMESLDVMNGKR